MDDLDTRYTRMKAHQPIRLHIMPPSGSQMDDVQAQGESLKALEAQWIPPVKFILGGGGHSMRGQHEILFWDNQERRLKQYPA